MRASSVSWLWMGVALGTLLIVCVSPMLQVFRAPPSHPLDLSLTASTTLHVHHHSCTGERDIPTCTTLSILPLPLADGLVFGLPAFSARLSSCYKTDRKESPLLVCYAKHGPGMAPSRVCIVAGRGRRDSLHGSAKICRLIPFSLHDRQAKQQPGVP